MRAILLSAAALALAVCLMIPLCGSAPAGSDSTLAARAPIRIDSDAAFTPANGVTGGSGTEADPWMIGGWDISGALHAYCIYVGNTTQPFKIENCRAHNASGTFASYYYTESGIIFYNVTNGGATGTIVEDNGFDGICLYNSSHCNVSGNVIRRNEYGLTAMDGSGNNTFSGNLILANAYYGIGLFQSPANSVSGNEVLDNPGPGISVSESSGNIVEANSVSGNDNGIDLWDSSGNRLASNKLLNNTNGIYLEYSDSNALLRNNVSWNLEYGIRLASSSGNRIYQNRLGNNSAAQARDSSGGNAWDDGYPSGGNWWGDYIGPDADLDGFGDTPYLGIQGNMGSRDRYPLMQPWFRDAESPAADAGPDIAADEDSAVRFNGSASVDNVGIVNYTWNYTGRAGECIFWRSAPERTFSDPGVYTVTLNVTDSAGNWGIDSLTMTVRDITPPVADAGPDIEAAAGSAVCLNGSASTDNDRIGNYTWTFDDGTADTILFGVVASHVFQNPGAFNVTLEVRDSAGLADSDSAVVAVITDTEAPVADAGPDISANVSELVTLDGTGSMDNREIANYTWNFTHNGSAVFLYGPKPAFRFWAPGDYLVTLTVRDAAGNMADDLATVNISDSEVVVADADEVAGSSKLWMLGLCVAAAVGLAFFVHLRKKQAVR